MMMINNVLAIDTSDDSLSIALCFNGKEYIFHEISPRQHAQRILVELDRLIKKARCTIDDMNAIAFGCGPGSFTGLRIAAGIVQGLAAAHDLPVIPICSLEIMAQGVYREFGARHVACCVDARMGDVYYCVFECVDGLMTPTMPAKTVKPDEIDVKLLDDSYLVGDGWDVYRELLVGNRTYNSEHRVNAQDCLAIGIMRFKQGEQVSAEFARPVYLREKLYEK